MEQGGLAGTGLAGDQHVLAGALADRQLLELLGAGAADRHPQLVRGVGRPHLLPGRGHLGERHLDPVRVDARPAEAVDERGGQLVVGRQLRNQHVGAGREGGEQEAVREGRRGRARGGGLGGGLGEAQAGAGEFLVEGGVGAGPCGVALDEEEDAAAGAAGGDAEQAFGGQFAEAGGEAGDDDEAVAFGDGAGLFVVVGDGGELVAEVHLDHLFEVLVEFGEAFLDLG